MLSPLDPSQADAWPDAVNAALLALLARDAAIFRLSDVRPAWVHPAPDVELARLEYRERFRSADPWARQRTAPGEGIVQTADTLLGPRFRTSLYYNEFLRPHRIHGYVGVQVGTTPGAHAHLGAFEVGGRARTDEALQARVLAALLPAFASGLRAWRTLAKDPAEAARSLDALGEALLLCDARGRTLHATPALVERLAPDPERERVQQALAAAAAQVASALREGPAALPQLTRERTLQTAHARYRVSVVRSDGWLPPGAGVLLLVDGGAAPPAAERASLTAASGPPTADLTPRELAVARLLADGRSNLEVAAALGVSANTAQTHTRHILSKLGLRSRAGVRARLHPPPRD